MRIAVTGVGGYLGGLVVTELARRGHTVIRLIRSSAKLPAADPELTAPADASAAGVAKADVLLLLGGVFFASHTTGDAERLVESNINGPATLADAFFAAGTRAAVVAGTSWQSTAPTGRPANPYAASRVAAWSMIESLAASYGASAISLRVADTYGPGDPRNKLLTLLRHAVSSGIPLRMSPGNQIVDPAFAPDVAVAFAIACEVAATTVQLNEWSVAGGEPMSLRDKVRDFGLAVQREVPVLWGARPYRAGEPLVPSLLQRPPWWTGTVPFREGVRITESEHGGLLCHTDIVG